DDWAVELERLALFLGNPGLADDADVQDAVRILVDKNLWHHRTSMQAVSMVNELYGQISAGGAFGEGDAQTVFQGALDCLGPEARDADAARKDRDWSQWQAMLDLASKELDHIIPPGSNLILVDDDCIGTQMINGRKITPFIERGGQYYGRPPDDVVAVNEFNRLHEAGAAFMAFVWPAHWWLDNFPGLNDHLRSRFRCILQNDRLVVFDLQS
ncbi:MAG: hypothetical protein U9P11_00480, partial [Pseudomonadota bacterium]|nr:hypothetical protein [Pseudomonadota bacterium]